ncbi:MAG: leucyl aminopeptidase [Sedimentisphaerales bacterium]|nr:leucyl aminopeptidase [Sedimentisphaerales bacterium]
MMKQMIHITVKATKSDPFSIKTDLLSVGVFKDHVSLLGKALDIKLKGAVEQVRKLGDFKGESKRTVLLYTEGKIGAKRLLLVGLGEKEKTEMDTLRKAAALGAKKAVDLKAGTFAVAIHQDLDKRKFNFETLSRAITEGIFLGGYRYDEFVNEKDNSRPAKLTATIVDADAAHVRLLDRGVRIGSIFGDARNFARTIMNRPANVVNPSALADEARKMVRGISGLTCTVWDDKQIRAKKMGGILAVGQGSISKPRFIVLKYSPAKATKSTLTIGLVGKAITFDSGGISIKPSEGMQEMKFDKSGGVAVLGAMQAIAHLKPKIRVFGIIPSAENMPGGGSYRPGDIIHTYSGKTVEIQNTDAEGRMILCDAIHYAVQQKCDFIVDIATLTGACVVALGEGMAGLMSNNDLQVEQIKAAAQVTGDRVWHLPCGEEFLELMKSKIAELKNIGGKWGGACTAGAFLGTFAGENKWAHIDMAGVGMVDGEKQGVFPGSIGYGVSLLAEYVCNHARK